MAFRAMRSLSGLAQMTEGDLGVVLGAASGRELHKFLHHEAAPAQSEAEKVKREGGTSASPCDITFHHWLTSGCAKSSSTSRDFKRGMCLFCQLVLKRSFRRRGLLPAAQIAIAHHSLAKCASRHDLILFAKVLDLARGAQLLAGGALATVLASVAPMMLLLMMMMMTMTMTMIRWAACNRRRADGCELLDRPQGWDCRYAEESAMLPGLRGKLTSHYA
eukprot:4192254-Amphidinium_carterae.1